MHLLGLLLLQHHLLLHHELLLLLCADLSLLLGLKLSQSGLHLGFTCLAAHQLAASVANLVLLTVVTHVVSDLVHGVQTNGKTKSGNGVVYWRSDNHRTAVNRRSHVGGSVDHSGGSRRSCTRRSTGRSTSSRSTSSATSRAGSNHLSASKVHVIDSEGRGGNSNVGHEEGSGSEGGDGLLHGFLIDHVEGGSLCLTIGGRGKGRNAWGTGQGNNGKKGLGELHLFSFRCWI
mmetsp:Transcript_11942/g.28594  ORF Transcript_11942/g.28594 Transcript_11942/m.28594 type:complete len:232 (+) Transcript_11942:58-753(+)